MLLTKNIIKFNNLFVKIPRQTKRVWDLAENRWGYKPQKKILILFFLWWDYFPPFFIVFSSQKMN